MTFPYWANKVVGFKSTRKWAHSPPWGRFLTLRCSWVTASYSRFSNVTNYDSILCAQRSWAGNFRSIKVLRIALCFFNNICYVSLGWLGSFYSSNFLIAGRNLYHHNKYTNLRVKIFNFFSTYLIFGEKELKNRLYTYPKRSSRQFPQKRCPHDVCQGSSKMLCRSGIWASHLVRRRILFLTFRRLWQPCFTSERPLSCFSDERSLFRNFAEDLYSFNKWLCLCNR